MPALDRTALTHAIHDLEHERDSRVLVLGASQMELELLPELYEACRKIRRVPRLDVVLHGRGGVVNAARRIALLLRAHAEHLAFIVPYHCESAATLLTLCGDEIVAGELALFSPIDPLLDGVGGGSISSQDIRLFGEMAERWFRIEPEGARAESLALLCNSIFPPTLTAFYRTTQEMAQIGEELLAWQLPDAALESRQRIVQQLMFGYHSHNYALSGEDMARLGLQVRFDAAVQRHAWPISRILQASVGGGLRESAEHPWYDTLLATRDAARLRRRHPNGLLAPQWIDAE
jgi:hypothetical protein